MHQFLRFLHSHGRQVFDKGLPGLLAENTAQMIRADPHSLRYRSKGKIAFRVMQLNVAFRFFGQGQRMVLRCFIPKAERLIQPLLQEILHARHIRNFCRLIIIAKRFLQHLRRIPEFLQIGGHGQIKIHQHILTQEKRIQILFSDIGDHRTDTGINIFLCSIR